MKDDPLRGRRTGLMRSTLMGTAVIGVVLGVIAVFWPGHTLVAVATLLGVALVVAGLFRLVAALLSSALGTTPRVLFGLLGLAMIVVGALVIARPVHSLVFVAVLIGIGWLAAGIRDLVFALRHAKGRSRTLALVAGVVEVVGAVVMFVLPAASLAVFAVIGGLLLIVVSVATLLTLPARGAAA